MRTPKIVIKGKVVELGGGVGILPGGKVGQVLTKN